MSGPKRRSEARSGLYWELVRGCTREQGDEFRGTGSYPGEAGAAVAPPSPGYESPDPDRTPASAAESVNS